MDFLHVQGQKLTSKTHCSGTFYPFLRSLTWCTNGWIHRKNYQSPIWRKTTDSKADWTWSSKTVILHKFHWSLHVHPQKWRQGSSSCLNSWLNPVINNSTHFQLVDIIHTNAGVLGSDVSVGKCDFWPNGGGPWQPGCDVKRRPGCDHTRSWLYYAESVQSREQNFHSYQCDDFNAFKRLNCTSGIMDFMGYHATENCTGTFYLQTNNRSPFSRDVFGLQYLPLGDLDRGSED